MPLLGNQIAMPANVLWRSGFSRHKFGGARLGDDLFKPIRLRSASCQYEREMKLVPHLDLSAKTWTRDDANTALEAFASSFLGKVNLSSQILCFLLG